MTTLLLFGCVVLPALALDLLVLNRGACTPTLRNAVANSVAWIALACAWGGVLGWLEGPQAMGLYFTAYLMEKSLSVDNLFVFSLIFTYFGIEPRYRHKVLYWGIIGAVLLRATMIAAGVQLVAMFSWLLYLFGAFLLYAGYKMFRGGGDEPEDVGNSLAVQVAQKLVPTWSGFHEGKFFVKEKYLPKTALIPKKMATRLLLALVAVELADVLFAVDSIPVVVAFTGSFTIAFTSNLMAVLGLRSLFFLLDHLLSRLVYLSYALGFALAFIGFKMLAAPWLHVSTGLSIGTILGALAVATLASVWVTRKHPT